MTRPAPSRLDVDALLDDPAVRIVVCCGAGGVGKTTTAAALALDAAERGRHTVVLTIDPARRLAQSMGLSELDNVPRRVAGLELSGTGSLDAMMLDMKRTFDEVVLEHATPEKAAQILENPFYQALSSSFSGTQEYMAMEKLGQLRALDEWDLIVVDTPPSRSALDFLDAPSRLGSFLDGRLIRILTAPARAGGKAYLRVVTIGIGAITSTLAKVLGGELLLQVQTFVSALDTMFGGFRERAEQTYALLKDPETRFLVVAAPERDAIREASYFVERLAADGMPLAGLVLNRVHGSAVAHLDAGICERAAQALRADPPAGLDPAAAALTASVLELHAERMQTVQRERRVTERFLAAHPTVPVVEIPAMAGDVHDLDGLRGIAAALSTGAVPTPL
jgi:anion-transporting  ArsA/GET3 family ATPase